MGFPNTAQGEIIRQTFTSAVLAPNPLGDPATRPLYIYLPPSYATAPAQRYPVIFMLTGFMGTGAKLLNWSAFEPAFSDRLDRIAANGGPLGEAIIVMPDCFTRLGGSQFMNSPATGQYADYLVLELVPYIDEHFRTLGTGTRGIAGHSSGGYGALVQAMRYPEVWSGIACHRGDMAFDLCYGRDFVPACATLDRAGGLATWYQDFQVRERKIGEDFQTLNIVAMAACYSPNPAIQPIMADLPFDLTTCEVLPDVWNRWRAHDPIQMIERAEHQAALRTLKLLYLEAGMRDEYGLQFGARRLHRQLDMLGIAHVYEEHDDTHSGNMGQRYEASLTRLIEALHQ